MTNADIIAKAREILTAALSELEGTPSPAIRDELAEGYATPFSVALSALEGAKE